MALFVALLHFMENYHWNNELFITKCCLCPASQIKCKNYETSCHFILLCCAPKSDWKTLTCKWLKMYLSHTKGLVFYVAARFNHFEIFADNLRSKYFLSVQIKSGCTENTTDDLSWNWNTRQQIQPNLTKWYR